MNTDYDKAQDTIWLLKIWVPKEKMDGLWELINGLSYPSVAIVPQGKGEEQKAELVFYHSSPLVIQEWESHITQWIPMWEEILETSLATEIIPMLNWEWQEKWKLFFHAQQISPHLAVVPSWENRDFPSGVYKILLDPGMSFGTGKHATTIGCLKMIDDLISQYGPMSFLDVGCGSGILSIAAAYLGCYPVVLFDYDEQAVRVAQENLLKNQIQNYYLFWGNAAQIPLDSHQFSLVCANLETPIILRCIPEISRMVSQEGVLILSGILIEEWERLVQEVGKVGFRLKEGHEMDGWVTGLFFKIN